MKISKKRYLNPYKGIIKTYKFVSIKEIQNIFDPDYYNSFKFFYDSKDNFALFYKRACFDQIIEYINKYFKYRIDKKLTARLLKENICSIISNIEEYNDVSIEKAAIDFLDVINEHIKEFEFYIPVYGIDLSCINDFEIGNCHYYKNTKNSELRNLIASRKHREEFKNIYKYYNNVPGYFKLHLSAHYKIAAERALSTCNEALNILRLYVASYYFDRIKRSSPSIQMGIAGILAREINNDKLTFPLDFLTDKKIYAISGRPEAHMSYEINHKLVDYMKSCGLTEINTEISKDNSDKRTKRVLRAIDWFSRATHSENILNSFIMYIISIECLFSEGRDSKEKYSKYVSTLVNDNTTEYIHPWDGIVSPGFNKKLKSAIGSRKKRNYVFYKRFIELYEIRNKIVHGNMTIEKLEQGDILDLETLSRNTILAFIKHKFKDLKMFKKWVNQNTFIKDSGLKLLSKKFYP
ncbi:MAG: hypothetical protein ACTSWR_11195 [Candidatus Helarchaeota archaeon]